MTSLHAENDLCEASDLRLLANVAYLSAKMGWPDESDLIYRAISEVTQTPAEVLFAWMTARCEARRFDDARELLTRLRAQPQAAPELLDMAECYLACASNEAEWPQRARAIVGRGPRGFGYETAQAMLDAQQAQAR